MKRKLALVLAISMIFTVTACGKEENNTDNSQTEAEAGTTDGTVGEVLLQDFKDRMEQDADTTPQELADGILTNAIIQFSGAVTEVQEGNLTGFSAEITGFEEGVMFSPMISSIPFVGYIFTVAEGGDVDGFVEDLKTNADPRWNICTEAEETVVEASGNTVFFLMCPSTMEE